MAFFIFTTMDTPIVLTSEFKTILDEMNHNHQHLFITGKAGTGKSTLLKIFRKTTTKNVVVLAPTGVAALHVKGQTIHSFFRIPPKLIRSEDIPVKKGLSKLMRQIDILVIDEISMVRADLFDHIDYILRFYRKSTEPFGGVKLLLFGDLYQLPPVVSSETEKQYFKTFYEGPYFFNAHVFAQGFQLYLIELTKVFRQKDKFFIDILDRIRQNECEEEDFQIINQRYSSNPDAEEGTITLTTTNNIAEQMNLMKLNALPEVSKAFQASLTGIFSSSSPPADQLLILKPNAQVMFLRNDPEGKYVNGTLGIIESLSDEIVTVKTLDQQSEEIIQIKRADWEIIRYTAKNDGKIEEEVIGSFKQFPLKLAWAVTIHKSQGKTFDKVILDMGRGAFEYGQAYVALSRCKSLDGIALKKVFLPKDIMVDQRIVDFYAQLR